MRWALLAIVVVVAVLAAGAVWKLGVIPEKKAECTGGGTAATVAWIGDSYPAGQGVGADNGYACLVGEELDWRVVLDAQGSTGFIADGHRRSLWFEALPERLNSTAAAANDAELVVVDAGRNDYRASPEELTSAVDTYLARVAQIWPEARVVVVLPWLVATEPGQPDWLPDAVRQAAVDAGVEVIDPEALGWADEVRDQTTEDGIHPSEQAQHALAERFAEALVGE